MSVRVVALALLGAATGAAAQSTVRSWAPPAVPAPGCAVPAPSPRILDRAFQIARPDAGAMVVRADLPALTAQASTPGVVLIRDFPLAIGRPVDLEVERFWVTLPTTRFEIGGSGERAAFDPETITLLRGRVAGQPHSHVYLALSDLMTNGVIDLGPGLGAWGVSSRARSGGALAQGELTIFAAAGSGGPSPIPFCLTPDGPVHGTPPAFDLEPRKGLRQLELAVETDNAFYKLFNDANATNTYLVQLYGAVSDIYMREINVRVDLVYVRIWPQANEPFTQSLNAFQNYWNTNMGSVSRDVAQMFSGRGDLPGGVAYLSALCGDAGYGFCGNALGYFADPQSSSVLNYDPLVTAHELGHNCGTNHTDFYGLDNCNIVGATPQRGTIMSYCNQTVSGAMANIDMGFHVVTRNAMLDHLTNVSCVVMDCNQNGRSDALDIALASSADTNANGIPDECEDCNHNNILDTVDITLGTSHDFNTNGIPDECEPDCNGNGIPDDRDILLATSQDAHGDGIPDECDADLNNNAISDYNEIWSNMPLDKDRNRVLDSKQDCDNDGIMNQIELQGAHDGWVAGLSSEATIREYHAVTGVLMTTGPANAVTQSQDLIITPTRRILVTSANTNRVVEFDRFGALVGTLVPAGSGGLGNPAQMALTPAGTLLVASRANNAVLEYNLTTGAFIRAFVASGSGGLTSPFGLTLGPSGNLFVSSSSTNQVFEYNGTTGAFVRIMVTTAGNGGLSGARGLVFKPDGNLLICGFNNDQVKHYNGTTGAYIGNWLITGLPIDGPWCIRSRPDGIYISRSIDLLDTHVTRARIFIHDARNGNFVRAYVQSLDSGLSQPTGFDFMPGDLTDCNANQIPDNCDIASGFSSDFNNNGKPDECERTCYANCDLSTTPPVLNVQDFACFLNSFASGLSYANCDGSTVPPILNVQDFACFLNRFAQGCP